MALSGAFLTFCVFLLKDLPTADPRRSFGDLGANPLELLSF